MTETGTAGHHADLLIELGCEELPPKALDAIRDALFDGVASGLEKNRLSFDAERSRAYSTPRRLALVIAGVADRQPDQELERRGPALRAAFDAEGRPTGAAIGFARSVGKTPEELETLKTDRGEWLYCRLREHGKPLDELLYPILEQAIRDLPVPKPMRWADHAFSFVRPVHWLIVLHGDRVVPGRLFGLDAGATTRGHRIHAPGPHPVPAADRYLDVLEHACVLADHERRKANIKDALLAVEPDVSIDPDLLREVTNLVEWPVAIACHFEPAFLEVPHAALIAAMQDHQKFFPVRDAANPGRVTNRFVAVANLESRDVDAVRAGYERVIRPRLADARFFLEQDLKVPLEGQLPALDRVVFQQKIGTVGDKTRRISSLSRQIAEDLNIDPAACERAARLAKCDLLSQMVGEFPELQGLMGAHYARVGGETEAVATAIGEHYQPRFAGDAIPASDAGQVVSLADRIDTLVGVFAAGLKPTGNKDPFALRRAALGLLRILLEGRRAITPDRLVSLAAQALTKQLAVSDTVQADVRSFIIERLRHYYAEQGFSAELITAALSAPWSTLPDLDRRLRALAAFMGRDEAASLAAANKRIGNILRKSDFGEPSTIDPDAFTLDEEKQLFEEVKTNELELEPLLAASDYAAALTRLASLRAPVDAFFDNVMVMDDDPAVRANRLALLARLKGLFDAIADLSVLG
ncbi:MAG: glycine--tRNA ligase subunit beta [Xanthomonadales bacterium]